MAACLRRAGVAQEKRRGGRRTEEAVRDDDVGEGERLAHEVGARGEVLVEGGEELLEVRLAGRGFRREGGRG